MLMGRRLKSTIPSRIRNDAPSQDDIRDTLYKRQGTQKHYFDQHAQHSDLPVLYPGQRVYVQDQATGMWEPAVVDWCTDDPRSYIVQNVNGRSLRRNRQHIRARHYLPPDTELTQNVKITSVTVRPSCRASRRTRASTTNSRTLHHTQWQSRQKSSTIRRFRH